MYGFDDYLPEPGPRDFAKVQGPRKAYSQRFIPQTDLDRMGRSYLMAQNAQGAVGFFETLASVDWKTLEFRIVRTGDEQPGETWRWEVWISG
jgi:hypothetical protein